MNQRDAKRFACYLAACELHAQMGSELISTRVDCESPDYDRVRSAFDEIIGELLRRSGATFLSATPKPTDIGIAP